MTKKLKIRFTKFEKALAMQILEQEGNFRNSYHIHLGIPEFCGDDVYLCAEDERDNLNHLSTVEFVSNELRDTYLDNVIRWISKEQFDKNNERMLKSGELCEVSDDNSEWEERKLITILPERFANRYIAETDEDYSWTYFTYARPIGRRIEPEIDGDIYTWEEK